MLFKGVFLILSDLRRYQILDVIFYYDKYLKENWGQLREEDEPLTVGVFYGNFYNLLKTMQEITDDNAGPLHCFQYIYDETGKVPSIDFCECCPKYENCDGTLPSKMLRSLIKKYGKYLEGDD